MLSWNFSNTGSLSFSPQEKSIPMDSSSQKAWLFLSKTLTPRSWCATTESEKSCPPGTEPYSIHPNTVDSAASNLSGTVMMSSLTNFQYASTPTSMWTFISSLTMLYNIQVSHFFTGSFVSCVLSHYLYTYRAYTNLEYVNSCHNCFFNLSDLIRVLWYYEASTSNMLTDASLCCMNISLKYPKRVHSFVEKLFYLKQ